MNLACAGVRGCVVCGAYRDCRFILCLALAFPSLCETIVNTIHVTREKLFLASDTYSLEILAYYGTCATSPRSTHTAYWTTYVCNKHLALHRLRNLERPVSTNTNKSCSLVGTSCPALLSAATAYAIASTSSSYPGRPSHAEFMSSVVTPTTAQAHSAPSDNGSSP